MMKSIDINFNQFDIMIDFGCSMFNAIREV